MDKHTGLPVPGYRLQSDDAVKIVTGHKHAEEQLLRLLDALAARDDIDKRWLSIGRSHFEQGWMAVNRAVFQPSRVKLPGEE